MSLFDGIKNRQKRTTRLEIGAKLLDENGIETYRGDFMVYFLIKPLNIAVLSESSIRSKILELMNLLKEADTLELACINSRETFEENKIYFKQRLENERNPKVREILEKDAAHLDRIQIQTASAREFMVIVRFKDNKADDSHIKAGISRVEKLLKDQGFIAKRADKEDIKRVFAVYFVQNLTQVYFDNFDGERFVREV